MQEEQEKKLNIIERRNMKIFSIGFVVMLVGMMFACIIVKDENFSENENRLLAKFPKLSVENIVSSNFSNEFEKYAADTVVGRDFWVKLKNSAEKLSLKKDNGSAYFGEGGQLFPMENIDNNRLLRNIEAFKVLRKNNDELAVNTSMLLAPTANLIWNYKLCTNTPGRFAQESIFLTASQELADKFIDIRPQMKLHEGEYIYYKTDHHWTALGAYYGYEELVKHLGHNPVSLQEFKRIELAENFKGSTEAKITSFSSSSDKMWKYESKNDRVRYAEAVDEAGKPLMIYDESFLKKRDKYSYFMGGNPSYIEITRKIDEREKIGNANSILIIKDSYANCLAPLLLENYDRVYMVDLRYYRKSIKTLIANIRYKDNIKLTDVLVLYNAPQFSTDVNAALMSH